MSELVGAPPAPSEARRHGADHQGRVVVVTGGSSGNGRAIALAFAATGAAVIVADVTADPREGGPSTVDLVREQSGSVARFVACDVRLPASFDAVMAAAEALGGVDVMVNNAGVLRTQRLLDASEAEYDLIMDVNVKGVYFGAQAAARCMAPRGRGVIINVSSIAGMRGTGGYALYNASKGAVRLLTMALADELGPMGVRVNAVHPGIIATAMNVEDDPIIGTDAGERYLESIPLRRWGRADEVADAVVYLASDRASYVNGASLVIDGGYLRI